VLELAEVLRRYWPEYERLYGEAIPQAHRRAVRAILRCRTAELGGQLFSCSPCQQTRFVYHSCNHRACPRCGQSDKNRWLAKQMTRLLPVPYFLVTFTIPAQLRHLARSHQKSFFSILLRESAAALQDIAANPKHLAAQLGMLGVLHTWTRQLVYHPHIHFLVPGGGLSADKLTWVPCPSQDFLLPVQPLKARFRWRMRQALQEVSTLWQHLQHQPQVWKLDWVVNIQAGGKGEQALAYLGQYIYRTALSSTRLLSDDHGRITFRYRNRHTKGWETIAVPAMEFVRRFLQHVLPSGFQRVRPYGWLSSAACQKWQRILALLDWTPKPLVTPPPMPALLCPKCQQPMHQVDLLQPGCSARGPPALCP